MSRTIALISKGHQLGTATLPSDYPADPEIVIWKGRVFQGGITYGSTVDEYNEVSHVDLADHAVTPAVDPLNTYIGPSDRGPYGV